MIKQETRMPVWVIGKLEMEPIDPKNSDVFTVNN